MVHVEHFEEQAFGDGRLRWAVGTGWPDEPEVWTSLNAPVREGSGSEAQDSWDVTSSVDTPEKANSLVLQVANDAEAGRKTSVDFVHAVVKWY